jgi:hypothetical protein
VQIAPSHHGLVRFAEAIVGAQMRRGNDSASGKLGGDQITDDSQGSVEFHTDFKIHLIVEINDDVSAGALDPLRADNVPNLTACLGNNLGKLLESRAAADNGRGPAGELLDLDVVVHEGEFYGRESNQTKEFYRSPLRI